MSKHHVGGGGEGGEKKRAPQPAQSLPKAYMAAAPYVLNTEPGPPSSHAPFDDCEAPQPSLHSMGGGIDGGDGGNGGGGGTANDNGEVAAANATATLTTREAAIWLRHYGRATSFAVTSGRRRAAGRNKQTPTH